MGEITSLEATRHEQNKEHRRQEYIQRIGNRVIRELPQTIMEAKTLNPEETEKVIAMLDSVLKTAQDYIRACQRAARPR